MHDLRLYVKDLLTEYAQLQRFDVKPSYHARCIDWARMLTEFEWPHYSKVRPRAQTLSASAAPPQHRHVTACALCSWRDLATC
jgi:hypothetical protein